MAQTTFSEISVTTPSSGIAAWIKRHPLTSYFTMAFAGTWIFILPLLLSRGFGLFHLPDALGLGLFILSTYTGPFLSAIVLSKVTGGSTSVRLLFKRIIQWRVGLRWYLLVFLGYPILALAGASIATRQNLFSLLIPQWSLIFSAYLPLILLDLFMPGLAEETGWRGFALPRLQMRYGPLAGSLILGALHALWHLPVYLIPGMMTNGPFNPVFFAANSLAIIALTFVWTWLFNNAWGSVFFAIYNHAASDANSAFLSRVLAIHPGLPFLPWLGPAIYIPLALAIILFTRGKLGYTPERAPKL
jgi:uncharacterized protein